MSLVKIPKKVLHLNEVIVWSGSDSQAWKKRGGKYSHKQAERENQEFDSLSFSLCSGYSHPETGSNLIPTKFLETYLDKSLNIVDGIIKGRFILIQNGALIYVTSCEDPSYKTLLSEKENILSVLKQKLSRPKQKDLNFLTRVRNHKTKDGVEYYCEEPIILIRNATLTLNVGYNELRWREKDNIIVSRTLNVGAQNIFLRKSWKEDVYRLEYISRKSIIRPDEYEISGLNSVIQKDTNIFDSLVHTSITNFPSNVNSFYRRVCTGGLKLTNNASTFKLKIDKNSEELRVIDFRGNGVLSHPAIAGAIEEDLGQVLCDDYLKEINTVRVKVTKCVIHTDEGDFDVPIDVD